MILYDASATIFYDYEPINTPYSIYITIVY
jgi:hypothetical protein